MQEFFVEFDCKKTTNEQLEHCYKNIIILYYYNILNTVTHYYILYYYYKLILNTSSVNVLEAAIWV